MYRKTGWNSSNVNYLFPKLTRFDLTFAVDNRDMIPVECRELFGAGGESWWTSGDQNIRPTSKCCVNSLSKCYSFLIPQTRRTLNHTQNIKQCTNIDPLVFFKFLLFLVVYLPYTFLFVSLIFIFFPSSPNPQIPLHHTVLSFFDMTGVWLAMIFLSWYDCWPPTYLISISYISASRRWPDTRYLKLIHPQWSKDTCGYNHVCICDRVRFYPFLIFVDVHIC